MRALVSVFVFMFISLAAYSASAQQTGRFGICQAVYLGSGTTAHVAIGAVEYRGPTATCPAWPDSTGIQLFFFCAAGNKGGSCHPTVHYAEAELIGLYQSFVSAIDTSRPALIFSDFIGGIQVAENVTFLRP